jgi:hypothetical protein
MSVACDDGSQSDAPAPTPVRKSEVAGKADLEKAAAKADASRSVRKGPVTENGGDPTKAVARPARDCKKAGPDSQCCDHEFGVDPEALAKACGYKGYLGEHRTFSTCQYRFDAGRETPGAITFALFENQDYQTRVDDHMSGFYGLIDGTEVPKTGQHGKVHYSGLKKLAWAWVDGWKSPRRVAWSQKECTQDQLEPLLNAMADAPEPTHVTPRVAFSAEARPLPAATGEGASDPKGSLLARYADRELTKVVDLELPTKSMRLVVMLLERAAKDSTQDFEDLFTENATRGLPDRRRLRSRSRMGSDAGYTFLTDFRTAAQRFGHDSKFACPPLTPEDTKIVQNGDAPMWCTYMTKDNSDLIVFSLVHEKGTARIDYVGFMTDGPVGKQRADGEPPPPPVRVSDALRANKRAEAMNRPDAVHVGQPKRVPMPTPPPKPGARPAPAPGQ